MDRSEPTFVPEWYKGASNNVAGSVNSNHNSGSLHSAPVEHNNKFSSRNRLSVSVSDHDAPRSLSFSDKASSSFRRSASSNGSMGMEKDLPSRVCSSVGWSNRDRDRDKEKNLDHWDKDKPLLLDYGSSYNLDSLATNTSESDSLRRSHSMVLGRRVDSYLKRPGHDSINGIPFGGMVTGITKSTFEKDFPSLGAEEKHWGSDLGRVSSPGVSTAIHNLPASTSTIIGVDGWTSALAEVPPITGVNGQVTSPSLTTTSSTSTGLNMAETLAQAQAPGRARTTSRLPSDSQKIEELHRQQILKLRPVTPSMLKNSGPNSADKSKTKGVRIAEFSSSKQFSPHTVIHTTVRSDVSKASHPGQFQVLNRERNGFSSAAKESPYSTNVSRASNSFGGIPLTTVPPSRGSINPKLAVDGQGGAPTTRSYGEKKIASQAQRRNDFFNSLRNKSSAGQLTNANTDQSCDASSSNLDKIGEQVSVDSTSVKEASSSNSGSRCSVENGNCSAGGCGAFEEPEKLAPDEEEAAFLRSLGWEENAGEEALTREEIETFLSEYKKRMPASNLKL